MQIDDGVKILRQAKKNVPLENTQDVFNFKPKRERPRLANLTPLAKEMAQRSNNALRGFQKASPAKDVNNDLKNVIESLPIKSLRISLDNTNKKIKNSKSQIKLDTENTDEDLVIH